LEKLKHPLAFFDRGQGLPQQAKGWVLTDCQYRQSSRTRF
jgi:hypothetical protein